MKFNYLVFLTVLLLLIAVLLIMALSGDHSLLGSDERGYVSKDVYAHHGSGKIQIVIVTGIHPREEISIAPVQWAGRFFALFNSVEIINYNIVVKDNPQNYFRGRANGEGLAADYILPDIKKSDYDLVIISHAHQPGYGEGFYVATPLMDSPSVDLARRISFDTSFNYYPVSGESKYKSTSARIFSRPLAASGFPTLVYEIPEWVNPLEAFYMSFRLLGKCYVYLS